MTEIVHPRGGAPVRLRPCPPWCVAATHFADDMVIDVDDGFHHYGPEAAVPTFDRMSLNDPEIIVKVVMKAWTCPLDAEPGPARVELQLAPGGVTTEQSAELTPGQARAVAGALLELAAVAERGTAQ